MRLKHYSLRTEKTYGEWIRRYILYHGRRHPREMGAEEVTAFLTHLAAERDVAASTQNQALSALLFLYGEVLDVKLPWLSEIQRVTRPARLPVVLTREEARSVLAGLRGEYRLMADLLYGSGLRLLECLRLRVKDVDFGYLQITVRDGKGGKDRVTVLPVSLAPAIREHLEAVKKLHAADLAAGFGRVMLPEALERKYPKAPRGMGLAMGVSGSAAFHRSRDGNQAAASCAGKEPAKRGESGRSQVGHRKACDAARLPAQLCHASAGGGV